MSTLEIISHSDHISIVINNKFGNSFGYKEAQIIHENIDLFKNSRLPLVFSSAKGKNFCAGGNLSFYKVKTKEECIRANESIAEALKLLNSYQGVSLCVVDGNCFGGGMELISCFDHIVSAPSSYFGFWQRKISLSFGWGGRERWKQRLSAARLKSLCLEARSFSSYEALRIGVVDQVIPTYHIDSFKGEWVKKNNQLPQAPIAVFKSLEDEQELFKNLWFNPEHKSILDKY